MPSPPKGRPARRVLEHLALQFGFVFIQTQAAQPHAEILAASTVGRFDRLSPCLPPFARPSVFSAAFEPVTPSHPAVSPRVVSFKAPRAGPLPSSPASPQYREPHIYWGADPRPPHCATALAADGQDRMTEKLPVVVAVVNNRVAAGTSSCVRRTFRREEIPPRIGCPDPRETCQHGASA